MTAAQEYFKLAGVWLACRQDSMLKDGDPLFRFLGEMDYHIEMHILLLEVRATQQRAAAGPARVFESCAQAWRFLRETLSSERREFLKLIRICGTHTGTHRYRSSACFWFAGKVSRSTYSACALAAARPVQTEQVVFRRAPDLN
jgi:hypothetical protein